MDRQAWHAAVRRIAKSWTQLNDSTTTRDLAVTFLSHSYTEEEGVGQALDGSHLAWDPRGGWELF